MRRVRQRSGRGPQRGGAAAAAVRARHRRPGQGPPPTHHLPRQQQLPPHHRAGVQETAALPHLSPLVSIAMLLLFNLFLRARCASIYTLGTFSKAHNTNYT